MRAGPSSRRRWPAMHHGTPTTSTLLLFCRSRKTAVPPGGSHQLRSPPRCMLLLRWRPRPHPRWSFFCAADPRSASMTAAVVPTRTRRATPMLGLRPHRTAARAGGTSDSSTRSTSGRERGFSMPELLLLADDGRASLEKPHTQRRHHRVVVRLAVEKLARFHRIIFC